jgi:hypothetical protein
MNTRIFLPALLAASLASAQPAAPDAAPAAASAEAKTEMQKWIEATDAQWQAVFTRDVTDVREAEARKLMLQYLNMLEDAIVKASKASDLDGAVALRTEQKRFGDTQIFPEKDDAADTAATVKEIRTALRAHLAKLETDTAVRAKALHARYDQALAQAQTQLTKAQRLDDALLVKAKRDEVAAAWITPDIAPAAEKTTRTAPLTPPKAPSASTKGVQQSVPSSKLKIVSATYGADTRTVDITERVRKVYESGEPALQLTTRLAADGRDPAKGTRKQVVITYEIQGKVKTKTFGESGNLNFNKDLE